MMMIWLPALERIPIRRNRIGALVSCLVAFSSTNRCPLRWKMLALGESVGALGRKFAGGNSMEEIHMLKRSVFWAGVVAVLGASVVASVAEARPRVSDDGWEDLGCVRVGRRTDRDVISVGRREGSFKAIKLRAEGNDIEVRDLKVIYGNGQPDDIQVRSVMRENSQTRAIDLKGRDRFIKEIVIVSKKDRDGRGFGKRGPGKLCAYGLQDRDNRRDGRRGDDRRGDGPRGGGKWVELGCQKVGFLVDRDAIRVGRREGRFRAIRLDVSNNDVFINDLRVIYANGAPDDIRVREEIRQGRSTRPLDLKGRDRAIDRIEMIYRSRPSFKGTARVCVYGLD